MTIYREPFMGFEFCGVHSSKYNLYQISNGNRYQETLSYDFQDNIDDTIQGHEGVYYFGTKVKSKPHQIHCFVDGITEFQYRQLKAFLKPTRTGKLIFDGTPYKEYTAKVSRLINFEYIPFDGIVYKGNFTIEMVSYDPYGYSRFNSLEEFNYDNPDLFYDSGILYSEYNPPTSFNNITSGTELLLYNGGNEKSKTKIYITGTWQQLTITNNTTNQSFTLSENTEYATFLIDSHKGRVEANGLLANEYHEGGYIEIQDSGITEEYDNVFFENGSDIVIFPENILFDYDMVGKYLLLSGEHYKIQEMISENELKINENYTGETGEKFVIATDVNEIYIGGENLNIQSISFIYKYTYI